MSGLAAKMAEMGMSNPTGGIEYPAANMNQTGVDPFDTPSGATTGGPTVETANPFAGSVAGSIPGTGPTGPMGTGAGMPIGTGIGNPVGIGGGPGITGSPGVMGAGPLIGGVPGGRGMSGSDPTFGLGHILDIIAKHKGTPLSPAASPIGPPRAASGGYPPVFQGLPGQLPPGRNMPYGWLGGGYGRM